MFNLENFIVEKMLLYCVVFSFLHAERSENGEKKLMIFGLEKRWKNGQILDICSPFYKLFLLWK